MNSLPINFKNILLSFSLLSVISVFSYPFITNAQTTGSNNAGAGAVSLAYSPPIIELTLDPGESYTDIIKVENRGNSTEVFYPNLFDFIPSGEDGGQNFIPVEESDPTYSLASWVVFPDEPLNLRPKETAARQFTISVPKNALPGGKYAALFFDSKAPNAQDLTGAKIQTRTGPLLLVTVTGETKENLKSVEFTSDRSFYERPPVNFVSRVENDGTVHVKPVGQITIKSMFGKVVDNIPVNETLSNILPNSTRKYELTWNSDKFLIGKYEAVLNLTYGTEVQKNAIDVISFWIIPWKLILILILVITLLIFGVKYGLRKYNEWVISKSKGPNMPQGPTQSTDTTSSIAPAPAEETTSIADQTSPSQVSTDPVDSIAEKPKGE